MRDKKKVFLSISEWILLLSTLFCLFPYYQWFFYQKHWKNCQFRWSLYKIELSLWLWTNFRKWLAGQSRLKFDQASVKRCSIKFLWKQFSINSLLEHCSNRELTEQTINNNHASWTMSTNHSTVFWASLHHSAPLIATRWPRPFCLAERAVVKTTKRPP